MTNPEFGPPVADGAIKDEHMNRYLERKALIRFRDAELTANHGGSYDFPTRCAPILEGDINEHREMIEPRWTGRRVINIGSGKDTFKTALSIFLSPGSGDGERFVDTNSTPSEYVGVDLFLDEKRANDQGKKMLKKSLNGISDEEKTNLIERINQVQADGLAYLLSQPNNSGNVLFVNINGTLIMNEDYLRRLAQEAYRIAGDRDIVACTNSREISKEAKELFPHSIVLGFTTFFSKEPFTVEQTKS